MPNYSMREMLDDAEGKIGELQAKCARLTSERDEAQKLLVTFAREIAGLLGVSVTPIDLDAIREALERAIESWKREERTWGNDPEIPDGSKGRVR